MMMFYFNQLHLTSPRNFPMHFFAFPQKFFISLLTNPSTVESAPVGTPSLVMNELISATHKTHSVIVGPLLALALAAVVGRVALAALAAERGGI